MAAPGRGGGHGARAAVPTTDARIRFDIEIASDFPFVPFDGILLEQVLMNLLDNAAKYAPAGTPIDIHAWIDEGEALVQVADRGPGLAAEELGRVFEKFYRGAHPTATAVVERGWGWPSAVPSSRRTAAVSGRRTVRVAVLASCSACRWRGTPPAWRWMSLRR